MAMPTTTTTTSTSATNQTNINEEKVLQLLRIVQESKSFKDIEANGTYNKIKADREYYTDKVKGVPVNELKRIYLENVKKFEYLNTNIPIPKPNAIRLMTWNVRYWTSINDDLTITEIAKTINNISP